MISVIVPVYNVEKYIRACLDSIINQTYQDLEILLIDDGSTDSSGAICDEYAGKDERIKVVHKENGGLSSARNMGLDIAQGEYVGFVDSDDIIAPEMYEKLLQTMQMRQTDVCMCGCKITNEEGTVLMEDGFPNKFYVIDDILEEVVLPLKTAAWNKLYVRTSIGINRFPQGKIHGEDLIFLLSFLTPQTTFSAIEEACYHYIKHSNTITTSRFSSRAFDEVYCKDEAYRLVEEKFSAYKKRCRIWPFRARMNLIRKMCAAQQVDEYKEYYLAYRKWVMANYKVVKAFLTQKEKIEFRLFQTSQMLYNAVVRRRLYK